MDVWVIIGETYCGIEKKYLEGGDRVDASDSPKQVDEYHLFKLSEERPGPLSFDNCEATRLHSSA